MSIHVHNASCHTGIAFFYLKTRFMKFAFIIPTTLILPYDYDLRMYKSELFLKFHWIYIESWL